MLNKTMLSKSNYSRVPATYMINENLRLKLYKLGEQSNKPFYQKLGFYEKFVESFPSIKSADQKNFVFLCPGGEDMATFQIS